MAGITPDPKKRSYLLPPGCKDLYDVLQPRSQPAPYPSLQDAKDYAAKIAAAAQKESAALGFSHEREEELYGSLSDLSIHLRRLAESGGLVCGLCVSSVTETFRMRLKQFRFGTRHVLSAALAVELRTEAEKAMQAFCARHHFPLPEETPIPDGFNPGLPVYQCYQLSPLPTDASAAAAILIELWQQVAGLDENTTMCFRYDELIKAA